MPALWGVRMNIHKTTTEARCLYCIHWVQNSIPVGWGTCLRYRDHEVDTSQDMTCNEFKSVPSGFIEELGKVPEREW